MLENSLKRFYLDSSLTASREVDTSTLLTGLLRFFVSVEGGGAAWSGALMQGVLMPVILVSSLTMSDSSWAANSGFGREAGGVSIKKNRRSQDLISLDPGYLLKWSDEKVDFHRGESELKAVFYRRQKQK